MNVHCGVSMLTFWLTLGAVLLAPAWAQFVGPEVVPTAAEYEEARGDVAKWLACAQQLNLCNGHGKCDYVNTRCICHDGWGSANDVAFYKAPDCTLRTCPAGIAFADLAVAGGLPGDSVAARGHGMFECSNAGLCDRTTGRCRCFVRYEGDACQRMACPGSPTCSGHGRCLPMASLSLDSSAEPISGNVAYSGNPLGDAWAGDKIQGCVCDSSWAVGYGSGQTQATEWWGGDCSLRRCPSGDDPETEDVDETDCEWFDENGETWRGYVGSDGKNYKTLGAIPAGVTVATAPTATVRKADVAMADGDVVNAGATGNKCYVECSKRGECDYFTGTCACLDGYFGDACQRKLDLGDDEEGA